jgi:hypothetical protein
MAGSRPVMSLLLRNLTRGDETAFGAVLLQLLPKVETLNLRLETFKTWEICKEPIRAMYGLSRGQFGGSDNLVLRTGLDKILSLSIRIRRSKSIYPTSAEHTHTLLLPGALSSRAVEHKHSSPKTVIVNLTHWTTVPSTYHAIRMLYGLLKFQIPGKT